MKAVLDAHYRADRAVAACVVFNQWEDSAPQAVFRAAAPVRAPYRAGRFYERELPGLLAVLARAARFFEVVVVDGYVHLMPSVGKGLGLHLHEALGGITPVVGVAKSPLTIAGRCLPIYRGRSRRPLFISAAGWPLSKAAGDIAGMHGPYRIPTLLRLADRQARRAPVSDSVL
jgi:deoxyribonuclease V